MHIALITKPGHADSGVGRYTAELERSLRELGIQVTIVHPVLPLPAWLVKAVRRWLKWDLVEFFNNYPIWARYPAADLYHVTSQNLATLLVFRRPRGKTLVTVHDIIPWLVRHDAELCVYQHRLHALFDRLCMIGLKRADGLVSDSDFSAMTLEETVGIPRRNVTTILLGLE